MISKLLKLINKKLPVNIYFLMIIFLPFFVSCNNPFIEYAMGIKTVSFNSNGGSKVPDQKLFYGDLVIRPGDPVRENYVFDDWYEDNDTFEIKYVFNNVSESSFTLHARWFNMGIEYSFIESADFGYVYPGYDVSALHSLTVFVTNAGEVPIEYLSVTLDKESGGFLLSQSKIENLFPEEQISFTVFVRDALPIGNYNDTVLISNGLNIEESFDISFYVMPIPITSADVSVTVPETDTAPDYTAVKNDSENYSIVSAVWSPSGLSFLPQTNYTVTVTLAADDDYTFTGLSSAVINGQSAEINVSSNGKNAALSYQFAQTKARIITGLSVVAEPNLNYVHNNTLNLAGLIVNIIYDTGFSENVSFSTAAFNSRGITSNPSHGQQLSHTGHNGVYAELLHTNSLGTNFNISFNNPLNVGKAPGALTGALVYNSNTNSSITFNTLPPPANGQDVEYAYNSTSTLPVTGWTTEPGASITFGSLSLSTSYYFFARTVSSANYETGTANVSAPLAIWTVTFDTNGGNAPPADQYVLTGRRVSAVSNPSRSGYGFSGWYNAAAGNLWNFTANTVTQNIDLEAGWNENTAGITLSMQEIKENAPLPVNNIIISRTSSGGYSNVFQVTVANPSSYGSIRWEIAGIGAYLGTLVESTGAVFTLNANDARYNSIGGHALRLFVTIDSVEYMRNINFTVVN